MKINRVGILVLFFVAVITLGLTACGRDNEAVVIDNGSDPPPPVNISIKTGTISTDSWGFTVSSPTQLAAPAKVEILIKERTKFVDVSHYVISGSLETSVSYSVDRTTLSTAAQASAPADLVSYLDLLVGSAKSVSPAFSVTVDVSEVAPGGTVNIYNYDAVTARWISPQTAVVSATGKITFPVSKISLWGIFL